MQTTLAGNAAQKAVPTVPALTPTQNKANSVNRTGKKFQRRGVQVSHFHLFHGLYTPGVYGLWNTYSTVCIPPSSGRGYKNCEIGTQNVWRGYTKSDTSPSAKQGINEVWNIYIYIHINIYACVYMYMYIFVYMWVCICICAYVYIWMCIYKHMHIYEYNFMFFCIFVRFLCIVYMARNYWSEVNGDGLTRTN